MKADTSTALLTHFLQDELYLLPADRTAYLSAEPASPVVSEAEPIAPVTAAPEPTKTEAVAPAVETPVITFKYMGGNKKKLLILTHYPSAQHIVDEHLTPLMSTLARINYTEDDIALLNMATVNGKAWTDLLAFFAPVKLLILGAKAHPAGIDTLTAHQIQQLGNVMALHTFAFEEMMTSVDNKKIFWNLVKTF